MDEEGRRKSWSLVGVMRSLDFILGRKAVGGFQAEKCHCLAYVQKKPSWLCY
jgi:hypothetical protein